jgi:hypothetical protein
MTAAFRSQASVRVPGGRAIALDEMQASAGARFQSIDRLLKPLLSRRRLGWADVLIAAEDVVGVVLRLDP